MHNRVYKLLILLTVFIAALFFMSGHIKEEVITLENTVEMKEASFPLLSIETGGFEINRLHGYSTNIAASKMREAITPLDAQKTIEIFLEEKERKIKKLQYEIRKPGDTEVLESGAISALEEKDGRKTAKLAFSANLDTSREYALKLTAVADDGEKIHYYTRIKYYETDFFMKEKLNFVKYFHEASMDKEKVKELVSYMEPSKEADNTTLARVTIHSSLENLAWGELKPEVITEIIPSIRELNVETAAVQLEYFVSADTGAGESVYRIKEFYRVRYTSNRIYLLNYERTMEELFDIKKTSVLKSDFKIGITSQKDLKAVTCADNTRVAFVREGALWYYNMAENKAVCVFSFLSDSKDYLRDAYDQHNIRILNMDDSGNMDFTVYGYMNRGEYEGKAGLVLYHFYADSNRIEEQVYIPLEADYQVMKEDIGGFSYVSSKGVFYFTVNNKVYSYNMAARQLKTIAEGVTEENFAVLEGAGAAAWLDSPEIKDSASMTILDLETEKRVSVSAPKGECIRIFGSMDGSVIFGYVRKEDICQAENGEIYIPAYKLEIADKTGEIRKTYKKKHVYIAGAEIDKNVAKLMRVKKSGNSRYPYKEVSEDSILSQGSSEKSGVVMETRVTKQTKTEYYLSLPDTFSMDEMPKVARTENAILSEDTTLRLPEEEWQTKKYYVYALGEICAAYENPAEAVLEADARMGVVLNRDSLLVWERGGRFNRKMLSQLKEIRAGGKISGKGAALAMLLSHAQVPADAEKLSKDSRPIPEIMEDSLKEPVVLTGCSLDEVLYFISGGKAVIAMKANGQPVVLTAYDETTVTWFDPAAGSVKQKIKNAAAMFEDAGNVFISYVN